MGLGGDLLELGHDLVEALGVVHPLLVAGKLLLVEVAGDGLALDLGGPLPVGAVEALGVGVAGAAGGAAAGEPLEDGSPEDEAHAGEVMGLFFKAGPETGELAVMVVPMG